MSKSLSRKGAGHHKRSVKVSFSDDSLEDREGGEIPPELAGLPEEESDDSTDVDAFSQSWTSVTSDGLEVLREVTQNAQLLFDNFDPEHTGRADAEAIIDLLHVLGVYDDLLRSDAAVKFSACILKFKQDDDLITRQDFINLATEVEFRPLFLMHAGRTHEKDHVNSDVEEVLSIFKTIASTKGTDFLPVADVDYFVSEIALPPVRNEATEQVVSYLKTSMTSSDGISLDEMQRAVVSGKLDIILHPPPGESVHDILESMGEDDVPRIRASISKSPLSARTSMASVDNSFGGTRRISTHPYVNVWKRVESINQSSKHGPRRSNPRSLRRKKSLALNLAKEDYVIESDHAVEVEKIFNRYTSLRKRETGAAAAEAKRLYLKKLLLLASANAETLNKRRFKDFINSRVVSNLPSYQSDRLLENIFEGLDANGDGELNMDEFYDAFHNVLDDEGLTVKASSDDFFSVAYSAMVKEIDSMKDEMDDIRIQRKESEHHLHAQIDERDAQLRINEGRDDDQINEIADLKKEVEDLRLKLRKSYRSSSNTDSVEGEISCLNCVQYRRDLEEANENLYEFRNLTDKQLIEIDQYKTTVENLRKRIGELEDENDSLRNELAASRASGESLRSSLTELNERLRNNGRDATDYEDQIASERAKWASSVAGLQAKIDLMTSELEELQLKELEAASMARHTSVDSLNNALEGIELGMQDLNKQISSNISYMQKDIKGVSSECNQVLKEVLNTPTDNMPETAVLLASLESQGADLLSSKAAVELELDNAMVNVNTTAKLVEQQLRDGRSQLRDLSRQSTMLDPPDGQVFQSESESMTEEDRLMDNSAVNNARNSKYARHSIIDKERTQWALAAAALKDIIDILKKELSDMRSTYDGKLGSYAARINELHDQLHELRQDAFDTVRSNVSGGVSDDDVTEFGNCLSEARDTIAELKLDKERLDGQLDLRNQEVEKLRDDLATTNDSLARLAAELNSKRKETDKLQLALKALMGEIASLKHLLDAAVIDNCTLLKSNSDHVETTAKFLQAQIRLQELDSELASLRSALTAARNNKSANHESDDSSEALQNMTQLCEQKTAKIAEVTAALNKSHVAIQQLEASNANLVIFQEQLEAEKSSLELVVREIRSSANGKINELEIKVGTLEEEVRASAARANLQKEHYLEEIGKLEEALSEASVGRRVPGQIDHVALSGRAMALDAEVERLRHEAEEHVNQIAKLESIINEQAGEVKDLKATVIAFQDKPVPSESPTGAPSSEAPFGSAKALDGWIQKQLESEAIDRELLRETIHTEFALKELAAERAVQEAARTKTSLSNLEDRTKQLQVALDAEREMHSREESFRDTSTQMSRLAETTQRLSEAHKRIGELTRKLGSANERLEASIPATEHANVQHRVTTLAVERDQLRGELSIQRASNAKVHQELNDSHEKRAAIEKKLRQEEARIQRLKDELKRVEDQSAKRSKKDTTISTLQDYLNQTTTDLGDADDTIAVLRREKAELERQLRELLNHVKETNSSSWGQSEFSWVGHEVARAFADPDSWLRTHAFGPRNSPIPVLVLDSGRGEYVKALLTLFESTLRLSATTGDVVDWPLMSLSKYSTKGSLIVFETFDGDRLHLQLVEQL